MKMGWGEQGLDRMLLNFGHDSIVTDMCCTEWLSVPVYATIFKLKWLSSENMILTCINKRNCWNYVLRIEAVMRNYVHMKKHCHADNTSEIFAFYIFTIVIRAINHTATLQHTQQLVLRLISICLNCATYTNPV